MTEILFEEIPNQGQVSWVDSGPHKGLVGDLLSKHLYRHFVVADKALKYAPVEQNYNRISNGHYSILKAFLDQSYPDNNVTELAGLSIKIRRGKTNSGQIVVFHNEQHATHNSYLFFAYKGINPVDFNGKLNEVVTRTNEAISLTGGLPIPNIQ